MLGPARSCPEIRGPTSKPVVTLRSSDPDERAMPSTKKRQAAKDVARRTQAPVTFVTPMAARLVDALPEGPDWTYELKFDGYRALILKSGDRVRLLSRKRKDLTRMYPAAAAAALRVAADSAVIDGEIVALDAKGHPSFQALQHRGAHPGHRIVFYAFDLLHLDGKDLMHDALVERREQLVEVIADSGLHLSADLPGSAADIVKSVGALGLEGIVAKRKESPYIPGERSSDWQKLKLEKQQEFVIGGFRPADRSIDALVVGYYETDELRFAGKVRAGFVPHVRRELFRTLTPIQAKKCPFVDLPTEGSSRWGGGISAEDMEELRWVQPKLVAQVQFVEWTAEGRLRHAKYLGLRSDKNSSEVHRETS
jgi:bifunctional non-homologous end joining protein LigD